MRAVSASDFSGGLSEQFPAAAFPPGSVAQAYGLVPDGANSLRSQWACELVDSGLYTLIALHNFSTEERDYVVALTDQGQVLWKQVDHTSWNLFTNGPSEPTLKFLCEIPRAGSTYTTEAADAVGGTTTYTSSSDFHLYANSGLLLNTNHNEPSSAWVVYESTPGLLGIEEYTDRYPGLVAHATIPNQWVPQDNVMPHANVGCVWGDRVFLADCRWFANDQTDTATSTLSGGSTSTSRTPPTPNAGNTRRYKNAIWVSEPGNPYAYDTLSLDVPVDADSVIVALAVVDIGMLVLTSTSSGESGLFLLRGNSEEYVVEKLRAINAPRRLDTLHRPVGSVWSAVGAFAFISESGAMFVTNGQEVTQIDGPKTVQNPRANHLDHLVTYREWLFASHNGRLLSMKQVGANGAWTELATPHPGSQVLSMAVAGENLFFIQADAVYRYRFDVTTRGGMPAEADEGASVFTCGTATMSAIGEDGLGFGTTQWFRTGFTVHSPATGEAVSIVTIAGPVLDSASERFEVELLEQIGKRDEVIAESGIGFVNEASAQLRLSGDVIVESATFYVTEGAAEL